MRHLHLMLDPVDEPVILGNRTFLRFKAPPILHDAKFKGNTETDLI